MAQKRPEPIVSKLSLNLDFSPSCIEFCPAHPDYFVVGTYNLQKLEGEVLEGAEKTHQIRNGSLIVFKLGSAGSISVIQTLSQPSAVLDLRFHVTEGKRDILAAVSSTGTLTVFKLNPEHGQDAPLRLLNVSRCDEIGDDVLFLQCQWQTCVPNNNIGITTSTGEAKLLILDEDWSIKEVWPLEVANTLEAWSIAFSPSFSPQPEQLHTAEPEKHISVYCGGDDSVVRYSSYDVRAPHGTEGELYSQFPTGVVKGKHQAGVTAILPLDLRVAGGRLVLTGSYDDRIRLLSIQDLYSSHGMARSRLLAEENLGGGVWRLNLIDVQKDRMQVRVLASCMHAGAKIVQVSRDDSEDSWKFEVLACFEEHKSMNYGSDFVPGTERGDALTVVSTSFYDKLLCLWTFDQIPDS